MSAVDSFPEPICRLSRGAGGALPEHSHDGRWGVAHSGAGFAAMDFLDQPDRCQTH